MQRTPIYIKWLFALMAVAILLTLFFVGENVSLVIIISLLVISGGTLLISLAGQLNNALIKPTHRLYTKDFSLKFIATLMGFFLVLGTALYLRVFYVEAHDAKLAGELHHPVEFLGVEYLLRSLISSLDLFMLDVDSNLLDRLDTHPVLKGLISVQAVLSFTCTVAMLVGLVYSRLHAYYRLHYRTKISDSRNHLYLFFGNNTPSSLLIKDIVKHDPKAVAVIIDVANVKEDENNEWDGIVELIAHKRKVFKVAEKIGAYVTIAGQMLDDIDDDITNRPDFDAFGYLGLSKIRKFIGRLSRTKNPQLHIFFMDENEELNIRNIITLAKDSTMSAVARDANILHRIYCHARFNGPNRVIKDVALRKHLNIRIVDSSHIAVELLKLHEQFHPVNVVSVNAENPATVDSPLSTLIVGFGEVGRDAFRFLYEFGSFLDSSSTDTVSVKSPFECVIVDRNLDQLKGTFKSMMPGIFKSTADEYTDTIRFESVDYDSEAFYDHVLTDRFLKRLNYVIISIGDNDAAIALAARIFSRVRAVRSDLSKLRILVRCTDDKKLEGIEKIARHYNFGYGKYRKNTPVINVFGEPKNTYTYELVVSDRLKEEGKQFYAEYTKLNIESGTWEQRHRKLAETEVPDLDKLRKLRRQESQDLANALHAATKIALLKAAMPADTDWQMFLLRYFRADGSVNVTGTGPGIRYPELSEYANRVILRLAMLEHLRWNSAHELIGYVFNPDSDECNEQSLRHNCLCPWQKLDEQSKNWDYKKFDFCVVDTSIALHSSTLLNS